MRKALAVVVGINEYSSLKSLSFCENDATQLDQILRAKMQISSTLLTGATSSSGSPTKNEINTAINEISASGLKAEDLAIFFFAGHGFSTQGKDYLACNNTSSDDVGTALCTDDIVAALTSSGAGTSILIVDACRENIDRSTNLFGERTAEMARQRGSIVFFSCSPGEFSKELGALGPGHGVFTYAFLEALRQDIGTPVEIDQYIGTRVSEICQAHKLGKQQPYTTVAPVQKATLNIFDGSVRTIARRNNMILIAGPSNAGKSTLGRYFATNFGYTHIEMSSFAWQRYNAAADYAGSLQDYLEDIVWPTENDGVLASDMLRSNEGLRNVVVCGPRRAEEIETIIASGWNIVPIFIYSNAAMRFSRLRRVSEPARYSLNYKDFIKKDLREYGWGLAKIAHMPRFELLVNEGPLEDVQRQLTQEVRRFGVQLEERA